MGEFPTSGRGSERDSLVSLPWSLRCWWSPREHEKGAQSELLEEKGRACGIISSSGRETILGDRKYGGSVSWKEGWREREEGRGGFLGLDSDGLGSGQAGPEIPVSQSAAQPGLFCAGSWLGVLRTSEAGVWVRPIGNIELTGVWLLVL